MRNQLILDAGAICLGATLCAVVFGAEPNPPSPQQVDFFEKHIRPVLVEHCYECHSAQADDVQGGLLLDNRAAIAEGGYSGPAVVAGKPGESRLILAMSYQDEAMQMPPGGKLPDEVIDNFRRWVAAGAADPREGPPPQPKSSIESRAQQHWAFSPPSKAPVPSVEDNAWPVADIDYLALAKMESKGVNPSPMAGRETLIRRLHFDLVGLPPSAEAVEAFVNDDSADAYDQLVDSLLTSPHFGERWARHWLDVSRFGDTKGYVFTQSRDYPNAYKFRDWVIAAFNDDMPFDLFLKRQIAADLLDESDRHHLAAMGFLTLGRRFLNNKHDLIDDRIDVVFRGTMGLTMGCARCHDHKYDPVSIDDYYGLYGVFHNSEEKQDDDLPLRLVDRSRPRNVRVFLRGSPGRQGDVVPRRFPEFFTGGTPRPFDEGSGRLQLAELIASRENPLTARVFVNRAWGHLFGEEIVLTPSDFGLRSEPPIQQKVLDQLAVDFMSDWSVKRLIRRIVTSSLYRQSSDYRDSAAQVDPENSLLWRMRRRRLDFEAMRDSLLAVSDRLEWTVGGPSVKIANEAPSRRRTVYAFINRQNLPGLFRTFDFASPDIHSPERPQTTVPQQALYLLNNDFVHDAAEAVAARVQSIEKVEDRVRRMYEIVYSRPAGDGEVALAKRYLESVRDGEAPNSLSAWQRYAQALLLSNEFIFLD